MRKEDAIHKMTGRLMFAALIHGGPHYRELREFMHLAHKTYKKFEEILDVDESDRREVMRIIALAIASFLRAALALARLRLRLAITARAAHP